MPQTADGPEVVELPKHYRDENMIDIPHCSEREMVETLIHCLSWNTPMRKLFETQLSEELGKLSNRGPQTCFISMFSQGEFPTEEAVLGKLKESGREFGSFLDFMALVTHMKRTGRVQRVTCFGTKFRWGTKSMVPLTCIEAPRSEYYPVRFRLFEWGSSEATQRHGDVYVFSKRTLRR